MAGAGLASAGTVVDVAGVKAAGAAVFESDAGAAVFEFESAELVFEFELASTGASGLLDRTDTLPVNAGIASNRAETMNNAAAVIVTFERMVAVPRGARAELDTLLVNNAPASVLPGCNNTAAISVMHERKKTVYKKYSNFLNHLFIVHDRGKTFRIETSSTDQCTVDIRLRHQCRDIVRFDRTAV